MDAAERISEHVWRLPLPSRTLPPFDHVNTYLIAADGVGAVVDPGSPDPAALVKLRLALDEAAVRLLKAVFLTHTHRDHVEGLGAVLEAFDGPTVYVHPLEAGRLPDAGRRVLLDEGRVILVGSTGVRALHTPGHSPGHLSLVVEDDGVVLVGDLIAGEGSSWVGVPEGDVAAYLTSLERVRSLHPRLLGPGHGPVVHDADAKLAWSATHRLKRERQLLEALADGIGDLERLRLRLYPDLPEAAHDLAERSLLAHLVKLMHEMKVVHLGTDSSGPYAPRR